MTVSTMSTVADVFSSSKERPITLRKRKDLTVVKQVYRNELFYLVKDPLELEFYRLNEEEFAVLELVNGAHSLEEVKRLFEKKFAPQRITPKQLQTFIADLHKKSLLAFTSANVVPQLLEKEQDKRKQKIKQKLMGLLWLKFRGVDPERFLNFITPKVGWIFSRPMVVVSVCLMLAAVLWLLVHYDEFQARLPALSAFLSSGNWLPLAVVAICMKIVHELAHAISFKRFGGECHEIGIMLLMLVIPTLFCGTTDSWLLKSKWQRAAIGAAGMYVELLIGAVATFVWWFSEPGTINMLCLNIMVTGTMSAVVMNANPFFKLDGYYIFSDIMELPNLQERAGRLSHSAFLRFFLGIKEPAEPNSRLSTKIVLVSFQIASFFFRVLTVVLINLMLIDRFNAYGLGNAAIGIGVVALAGLTIPPCWKMFQFFKVPGRLNRIEMKRALWSTVSVVLLVLLIGFLPLPHYVKCPLTIQTQGEATVFVEHEAILKEVLVKPGESVQQGQIIARLENLEKSLELSRIRAKGKEHAAELELLEQTRETSPTLSARIGELREELATDQASLKELEAIVSSFDVYAPSSGQIIPKWTGLNPDRELELSSFEGALLKDDNRGSWLRAGQELCKIGELTSFDAVLAVNEHDIGFIRTGQAATVMLDALPGQRFRLDIDSVARKVADNLPDSLAAQNGGSIQTAPPSQPGGRGGSPADNRPNDEHFEARVKLPNMELHLSNGLRGQARIQVGYKTIAQRFMMLAYRNLRQKLN